MHFLKFFGPIIVFTIGIAATVAIVPLCRSGQALLLTTILWAIIACVLYEILRKNPPITANQIPAVFLELKCQGNDGSYALFSFEPRNDNSGDEVFLQFSIENGVVGLDWTCSIPKVRNSLPAYVRNNADRSKFVGFANALGFEVANKEMNNVMYLRVERGGSLSELAVKLMHELYNVGSKDRIKLETDGFTWKS